MRPRGREAAALIALALVVAAGCTLASQVRATRNDRAAVDEPQYLLTALSLWEDRDLDISDELAQRRWFTEGWHASELPVQTRVLPDGRQISPHDPLLPLLLAAPVGLAGLDGARGALALLAGALAALLAWTAEHRLAVRRRIAVSVALVAGLSAPLVVYGAQVYPELPAALLLLAGVVAASGELRPRALVVVGAVVGLLPWLSVKYAPVGAALAVVVVVRLWRDARRSAAAWLSGGLAAAAGLFALGHQQLYGGWTAYATGDHFADTGELSVVGVAPDYLGRTVRTAGLLVDRGFGLGAWAPVYLLAPLVLAAALRQRRSWTAPVVAPLLAGYATAVVLALTMHGFWWPGRQTVVVLPLVALLLARAVEDLRPVLVAGAALAVASLSTTAFLLRDGVAGRISWVFRFEETSAPAYRLLRVLLPDYRVASTRDWTAHVAWSVALTALAVLGWARPGGADALPAPSSAPDRARGAEPVRALGVRG